MRSNEDVLHESIRPKNMPRYEFSTLGKEIFAKEVKKYRINYDIRNRRT